MPSPFAQGCSQRSLFRFAASPIAAAVTCLALVLPILADDPPPSSSSSAFSSGFCPKEDAVAKFQYNGCLECHDQEKGEIPGSTNPSSEFHMDFRQYTKWRNEDWHSRAHRVAVEDEAGKRITQRLGYSQADIEYRCLTCHAPLASEPEARFASPKATGKFELRSRSNLVKRGVGCEVCHGPASGKGSWLGKHDAVEWRERTPAQKLAAGMLDMRHPVTLAERCTTCHIGRADKDPTKSWIVTHDMYAAGHPPLPAIELATYTVSEPYHWRWLKDKGNPRDPQMTKEIRNALAKSLGVSSAKQADWIKYQKSTIAVVGAAVNLREAMLLTANQSAAAKLWPEYAQLDCYVCHHELSRTPRRQEADHFQGAPGRTPYPHWQTTLAEVAIEAIPDPAKRQSFADEFAAARWKFRKAFLDKPLGVSKKTTVNAGALASWADKLVKELDSTKVINDAAAARMLQRICAIAAEDRSRDFDAARQLAWMFKTIYADLRPSAGADDPVLKALAPLDPMLALKIPTKAEAETEEKAKRKSNPEGWDPAQSPYSYETFKRMEALFEFNPQAFQANFAKVKALLP